MSSRVAAALPLLFALHCAEKVVPTDSMFDPDNSEGDYRLETQWSPGGDTICVFLPCTLHCSSAGDDELTGYRCSATPAGCMMPGKGNHDFSETPVLRFIAPGPCTLLVSGMRPNRVTVDSSYPLIIVNPFRIIVDSASLLTGDSVKFRVINTRCSTAADSALNVRWSVDGDSAGKPLLFDSHFVQAVVRPDTVSVSATINDPSGKGAVLDSARIAVPKKRIPSVIIDGELRASTDNSFTIVPSTTNADSLLWHIAGLINKDTVTTASPLSLTWSDSTDDTIIVIAKNRFGSIGASDTIYIQVRASAFVLDMIRFPGSVPARRMTFWEVVAKRGSEVIPDSEVTYRWTVTPDSAYDSIKIENGMLSLYFADDPGIPVIVSVDAIAGADTSLPSTRNVTVIADKPVLEIISLNDSIGLGDTSLIIIRTSDTNEGGSIVGKYCRVEGDSAAAMDSDTLRFVGRQPGEQTVDFWCVDNDGFSSAHITAHLLVTSINPYFLRSRDSITVYVNDPATIAVPARAGNAGGTITQWLWDFGADGSVDFTTSIDHLDTLFTEAGTITLRVGCRDNRGDSAETPAVRVITISTGAPFISLLTCSPDTVYRGDSVNVRIAASDPNGSVDTLLFGTDSLSPRRIALPHRAASTDTTIRCAMKATGSFRFAAAAVDDDGLRSAWYAADAATVVKKGNPTVTKITPDTCWMFDTARYTISASDPDGSVASYMIQWEQGGAWKTAADSTVGHSYSSSGTKLVRIVAIDNRGDMSDTLTDSVAVKFGRPAVSTDSFPDSAWINDMAGYTLSGSDPNGDIKAWAVQWSPDSAFETRTSNGSFTHAFHDTGTQELKAFVKDDDGLTSDTVEVTVYVKLGAPFVISVNASSPTGTSIFILDTIRFTLRGDDPNGHIDSALVWWNGDTGSTAERVKAANDSAVFTHVFGRNENGNRTSRFRVMDDDKLTKDFVVTRMVRLGSPVVTSARCERDTIWVNDAYKYYVSASDTNGFIRKIYANWEGGDAAQDSLMISGNRASIDTFFTHAYDTSGGAKTTRFKTIDEDTVASAFRDTAFTVRKGAPALWGDTDDTLWVAVDEGYRDYYYKPNYRDTNGTIQKFYFGASADTGAASYKGPADSAVYTVSALTIDVGDYRYIYALDDDGLLRGERFVVFPDSAPPRPASFISSTISDSTILKWEKVLDTKDGVKTQVQIFIKEGSSGEPDVPLFAEPLPTIDDPRFGEETISTLHATYKFKCSFSGLGRWRVVLRDARGTESIAPNTAGDPATFVAP